jgi:hypothetical protein
MKKFTEKDVSDEVRNKIWDNTDGDITYQQIAEAWNHYPDKLTWRWEGWDLFVGNCRVSGYYKAHCCWIVTNVNLGITVDYLTQQEARTACEQIANDFIKQLTER